MSSWYSSLVERDKMCGDINLRRKRPQESTRRNQIWTGVCLCKENLHKRLANEDDLKGWTIPSKNSEQEPDRFFFDFFGWVGQAGTGHQRAGETLWTAPEPVRKCREKSSNWDNTEGSARFVLRVASSSAPVPYLIWCRLLWRSMAFDASWVPKGGTVCAFLCFYPSNAS